MKRLSLFKLALYVIAFGSLSTVRPAIAGSFSADFDSGLPPGTTITRSALISPNDGTGGGYTNTGCLQLTTNQGSVQGTFIITNDLDAGAPIVSFSASFKALIGSLGIGADGMSFNFAPDIDLTGNWG